MDCDVSFISNKEKNCSSGWFPVNMHDCDSAPEYKLIRAKKTALSAHDGPTTALRQGSPELVEGLRANGLS
jgi:hypothetical protein